MDKEFEKLLQQYNDEFVKFKREVRDTLENLDFDNFSENIKRYFSNSVSASAGFEASADTYGAQTRMFAQFNSSLAEIKATANKNSSSISSIASSLTGIKRNVSSIEQTADENGAFIQLLASSGGFKSSSDAIQESDIAEILISAMNEHSEIKLKADIIQFGDYSSVDSSGNFYAERIFGTNGNEYTIVYPDGTSVSYPGFFYAEINSDGLTLDNYGADFVIKGITNYGPGIVGDELVYGFVMSETLEGQGLSVNFVVGDLYADNYEDMKSPIYLWGYNYEMKKFYPKETWDFSSCNVLGLGVVPVFG